MRRKGELSKTAIDRDWPHQVAVQIIDGQSIGPLSSTGALSSLCRRGHEVGDGKHRYHVYCFSDPVQAAQFRDAIRGEDFDPRDRTGNAWVRGKGAKRHAERSR